MGVGMTSGAVPARTRPTYAASAVKNATLSRRADAGCRDEAGRVEALVECEAGDQEPACPVRPFQEARRGACGRTRHQHAHRPPGTHRLPADADTRGATRQHPARDHRKGRYQRVLGGEREDRVEVGVGTHRAQRRGQIGHRGAELVGLRKVEDHAPACREVPQRRGVLAHVGRVARVVVGEAAERDEVHALRRCGPRQVQGHHLESRTPQHLRQSRGLGPRIRELQHGRPRPPGSAAAVGTDAPVTAAVSAATPPTISERRRNASLIMFSSMRQPSQRERRAHNHLYLQVMCCSCRTTGSTAMRRPPVESGE